MMNAMPNVLPGGYVNPWQMALTQAMQQMMQPQQMQQPMQQPMQPQPTTPPMIHADIIEVPSIEAMKSYPVGAGQTQMFSTQDESAIGIKTMHQDGTFDLDVYLKQAHEPAPEYMTREQVTDIVRQMMGSENAEVR